MTELAPPPLQAINNIQNQFTIILGCEHDTSCVEILAFNKFVVNLEGKVVQDILQNYFDSLYL